MTHTSYTEENNYMVIEKNPHVEETKGTTRENDNCKTVHVIYDDLECDSHKITKLCNPQIMFLETQQKDIIYKGESILQEARWREVQFKRQIQG